MIKDLKLEGNKPIAELKNKLWQSFNILRGHLAVDEYYVILFLLSLFNEKGELKVTTGNNDHLHFSVPEYDLSSVKIVSESERINQLYSLSEFFQPWLEKLSSHSVFEIQNIFQSLDRAILKNNFPEIFDFLLFEISKLKGNISGTFVQPIELSKFICGLANLGENGRVYNPFAGYASFRICLSESISYYGQEIDYGNWAIGQLRILAHNKEGRSFFFNEDSLMEWGGFFTDTSGLDEEFIKQSNPDHFKFSLIVSNPPFGMRLTEPIEGKFGTIKTYEHFLIEKGIDDLRSNGKLIALLPLGFLFRSGSEQNLRKFLIENDLVDAVISMPGGLLMQTMVKTVVLVLNKNKKHKGIVRFVDGTSFVKGESTRGKILDEVALLAIINSNEFDEVIRLVPNEIIISNDYNLSVPRYFKKTLEGVELKEFLTSIRGRRNESTIGKIIRIKDLKVDKFNYQLEVDIIEDMEIPGTEQEILESCLLVASVGEKLKPTYFNYTGTPIYVSPNILILKVDEQKVDLDYLINELYADSTAEQHNSLLTGTAMQRLRKEDFLSIEIDLPKKSEQKAKVIGLKEEHIKNKERELILERELLGLKDETFREFASIKHTFSQYLNALKSNVSGTKKFISNNADQHISLNSIFSKNLNRTLGEHLISLEGTIDSMSKLLSSFEGRSIRLNPVEGDFQDLIEEAQNRFANLEVFQFEKLYVDKESFARSDGEYIAPMVYIHPEDFFSVFSNVTSNAVDHGFKNREGNIIRTSLSFDAENLCCILEVSNNGWPPDSAFTLQHLTTRGEKSTDSKGSGVGGADIKSILAKYNGTITIRKDENTEFPLTYVIGLPLVVYLI